MEDQRIIKGQRMKIKIIETAIKILEKEGIEGISAHKIADTLDVSKSNIFHHYKSINNIIEEVFETLMQFMIEPITVHGYERLEDFFMYLGQSIYNLSPAERTIYVGTFQFYTFSLYNNKYQHKFLEQKEKMIEVISNELYKLSGSEKKTCSIVSKMILMTLDGYGLSALIDQDNQSYEELWKVNTSYWCHMLNGVHYD